MQFSQVGSKTFCNISLIKTQLSVQISNIILLSNKLLFLIFNYSSVIHIVVALNH
jgi:hypothetical protein